MNKTKKIIALLVILSSVCSFVSANTVDELTNVALSKEVTASSEADENSLAEFACDGINDNEKYTKWKSADSDKSPQITVDLGIAYKIKKIELEAAKGETTVQERSGFKVSASETDDFKDETQLYQSVGAIDKNGVLTIDVTQKTAFRYVRISKTGDGELSFGEIKVFAETAPLANIVTDGGKTSAAEAVFTDDGKYIIPTDAKDDGIENELGLLAALKIMQGYPDGGFYPYNYISRAEFAAVAVRLLDMQDISAADAEFSDVSEDYWAYKYINTAKSLKLVSGVSDGIFMPDENITYEQMQKILVCVLGYGAEAEASGGYPNGYAVTAARLRLLNKVSADEEYVTRRNAALMLYNALMAKPFLKDANNEYETADENLLEYVFGITYFDGTVDGVNGTSLTDDKIKLGLKRVSVDKTVYDTEYPYFETLFSLKVRCFVNSDDVIVYAYASKANNRLEIKEDDFVSLGNNKITYYENDKLKTVNLDNNVDVLFNGKALRDYNADEIFQNFDRILLINNDDDGVWETMSIECEKIGVVSWVNEKDKTIYFKNTTEPLEYDDTLKLEFISSTDGSEITVDLIKEYDVLNILESRENSGEKIIKAYVTSNKIYGAVSALDDETVVIKNKSYEIWEGFDIDSVKIGERVSYYTDRHMRIVYSKKDTVGENIYGYLQKAYYDDTADKAELRIFSSNGKFMVYKLKKNILLDGKQTKVSEATVNYLKNTALYDDFGQPIRYEMNDNDEIDVIDTLAVKTDNEYDTFRCNVDLGDNSDSIYYSSARIFDARYILSDSALIMRIPTDTSVENEFEVESSSKYKNGHNYSFWGYGNDNDTIDFIISRDASKADRDSRLLVVGKIYDVYGADGDAKKKISGYYNGEIAEFEENTAGTIENAGAVPGDIFMVSLDTKNRIQVMNKVFFDGDVPDDVTNAISVNSPVKGVNGEIYSLYQNFFLAYATVMTKKDGNMLLKIFNADGSECEDAKNNGEILIKIPSGQICVYDSNAANSSRRVYVGDSTEITDAETIGGTENASKVIIKGKNGVIRDFILLK